MPGHYKGGAIAKERAFGYHSIPHTSIPKSQWEKVILIAIGKEKMPDLKGSIKKLDSMDPTSFHHHPIVDK